ncbi:MAG: hypothetical protein EHM70_26590, partial [Chloroflexota bacterium]
MHPVAHIVHTRKSRRTASQKRPESWAGLTCSTLISLFVVLLTLSLALVYIDLTRDLPSLQTLPALLEPPNGLLLQPTRIYDRSGQRLLLELENPAVEKREYIALSTDGITGDLPTTVSSDPDSAERTFSPFMVQATIAAADPTFWRNPGFSLQGLREGEHPTIAQRLVSELVLWDEPAGLRRNLRERLLAAQLVAAYGREKVLEWYLNSARYGEYLFGAEAASRAYLGKPSSQLSLAEAALLAAVSESPSLNPFDTPQIALDRQKNVLDAMLFQGLISQDDAGKASLVELNLRQAEEQISNPAPVFTNLVLEQLDARIDFARVERGGFIILTTLDGNLQAQAMCASALQLERLQTGRTNTAIDAGCEAARLLPTIPFEQLPENDGRLAANIVVMDPKTGQLLALAGENTPGLDPAHLPGHPPGSLLTPFIQVIAYTRGLSPASLAWDIPSSLPAGLEASLTSGE